jgi:hypothetical protein
MVGIIQYIKYSYGQGCIIVADDDNYRISDVIYIVDNSITIATATISGIQYTQDSLGKRENPVTLIVRGITEKDIEDKVIRQGMLIVKGGYET